MKALLTLLNSEFFLVFIPSLSSNHKGESERMKPVDSYFVPFFFLV